MSDTPTRDWIKPGAPVVVYQDNRDGLLLDRETTIAKVATKSFTVGGMDDRFRLDSLATKDYGTTWSRWRYRVTEPGSGLHEQLKKERARRIAKALADDAVRKLAREGLEDLARVDEAIGALNAWRKQLEVPHV